MNPFVHQLVCLEPLLCRLLYSMSEALHVRGVIIMSFSNQIRTML